MEKGMGDEDPPSRNLHRHDGSLTALSLEATSKELKQFPPTL